MTLRSIALSVLLAAATILVFGACSTGPDADSAEAENVGEAEQEVALGGTCTWGGPPFFLDNCDAGLTCCTVFGNNTCRDMSNDENSCGACGEICMGDSYCLGDPGSEMGHCACVSGTSCTYYERATGTYYPHNHDCANLQTDTDYCGSCNTPCSYNHNTPTCQSGTCFLGACNSGWGNCNGSITDGCETSTTTTANCGSCGNACSAGKACIGNTCVCTSDAGCAAGEQCNTATHVCVDCMTDAGCSGGTPHCDSTHTCVACVYHDDCPAGQLCRGTPDGTGDTSYGGYCVAEPLTPIYCTADSECSGATGNTVYEFGGDSDPANNPTADNKIKCCGAAGAKKCVATAHDPKFCASAGGTCGTDLTTDPNKDTCYSKMVGGTWTTSSCKAGTNCPAFVGHYDRHE